MPTTQITTTIFKKGAYIVVEGEKSEGTFFIIQKGHVKLIRAMIVPEISHMNIGEGDFFEVESALTGKPRLFAAIAMTDCSIIIVPKNMFDILIQKRPSLVQKIILLFSQRMRNLDHILAQVSLEKEEATSHSTQLMTMAKYYESVDLLQPAAFSAYHYMKNNPHGTMLTQAQALLDAVLEKTSDNIEETFENNLATSAINFKADQMIFGEGMPGDRMYFIQEGSVKICKIANGSEIILAVLNKGDLFGEMALLEKKPRSANAMAATNCSLLIITNENFPLLIKRQPKLITRITTVLAERIWFVYRQIANVILPQGEQRLFDALMLFMERQGVSDFNLKRTIELKMSPKDFIHYTGMDTKVANNILKEFTRDNVITIKNNHIIINNSQYVANRANHFRTTYEATVKRHQKQEKTNK